MTHFKRENWNWRNISDLMDRWGNKTKKKNREKWVFST